MNLFFFKEANHKEKKLSSEFQTKLANLEILGTSI